MSGRSGASAGGAAARQPSPREPASSAPPQNAEIFTLTYGSMVRQLIADYEDVAEVNKQLDKMCAAAAADGGWPTAAPPRPLEPQPTRPPLHPPCPSAGATA